MRMTWYTASVLISIKPINYEGGPIQVYENMYLIEAPSSRDAIEKAQELGRQEVALDDELSIDGIPAVRTFVGIRKIVSISNPSPFDMDQTPPTNGTELTYALYQLEDEAALTRLAGGEEVYLLYLE
ncbi:hypothetical protein [Chitiniphilus shinanonensis]|uniref:hypothetical protein n=1 Tax=Chitiniphilus shinanonensis TaxID=553088 RepID=UPI00304E9FD2